MKKYVIVVLLIIIIINLAYRIDLKKSPHELLGELMYFPSGVAVRALSLGLYAPLADIVWLRFIQYYGEHRMTDARFELMFHILDILTTLDSQFAYAYTLGGLMLTHDAARPDQAKNLLRKGMVLNPDDWRYPYMYGFIHYVFLRDYRTALAYFRISAQKPNAPDTPKRWAAYVAYAKQGDLRTSFDLWRDLYNTTDNPEEKAIALYSAKKIKMLLDIELLSIKIDEFRKRMGRLPYSLNELVMQGFLESIPQEPHDARYVLKGDTVYSSWSVKE